MKGDRAQKEKLKWGTWELSFQVVDLVLNTSKPYVLKLERDVLRDGYHLIMLCLFVRLAEIAGQRFGSISIKVLSSLIILIVLPKVVSGAPLGLLLGSQEES